MDGDTVFINRLPTTLKHSLQALVVYIHDDHTVKINPLICGPLGADFDGDCVHLFYPQSLAAKAEVLELFSVEKQLLSSHSGNLNLQLSCDSLLSLKMLVKSCFLDRAAANQMAMFLSLHLPMPDLLKASTGDLIGYLFKSCSVLCLSRLPFHKAMMIFSAIVSDVGWKVYSWRGDFVSVSSGWHLGDIGCQKLHFSCFVQMLDAAFVKFFFLLSDKSRI